MTMPIRKCEVEECSSQANFEGFGRLFCWKHYSSWLMSYRESATTIESDVHPQIPLDFETNG